MSVTGQKLRRIKALASSDGLIDVACFQFINIESIKKAVGLSWPEMREKFFSTGETFLEHRLAQGDIIIQSNDGFLVVFEHLSHSEAEDAAKDLSVGMLVFFLGDEYLKKIKLSYLYKSVLAEKIEQLACPPKMEGENSSENKTSAPLAYALPQILENTIDDIALFYYPIWYSVTNQISCYTLLPQSIINGVQYTGIGAIPEGVSAEYRRNLDLESLRKAQEDFINLLANGKKSIVSVTVSYEIFKDNEAQTLYIRQLRELPEQYTKFILICVDEIPQGTPEFQLVQNLKSLKNLCGSILIHNLHAKIKHSSFSGCGVKLFGFNLSKFLIAGELHQNEILKITKFCEEAKRCNAEVYFTNVAHRRQILTLKRAGVQYFSGTSVGGKTKKLQELKRLTPKEIFQRG
ncbi:MAG: hypothetical protein COA84_12535 [Robiginitomaculum sp.]|nr:MAG: hypothetical protein COA84_12535 [Robiginitomaculum sp.]